jgi:hypothetical protein
MILLRRGACYVRVAVYAAVGLHPQLGLNFLDQLTQLYTAPQPIPSSDAAPHCRLR